MRFLLLIIPFLAVLPNLPAQSILGFDLSNATVPVDEIHRGGPPPDGIPAIDEPQFTAAGQVDYLEPGDTVIGFSHGGVERAYPLRILVWHEIVNDTVGGLPVAVVYCPLCGTATVFERSIDGKEVRFGVSGLLYNSDVLMFDRLTKSLWSQLAMEAISGPMIGTPLTWLPSSQMTWEAWRERHPNGEALNTRTGFKRDYRRLPYQGYEDTHRTMFPYQGNRDEHNPKTWIAGVLVGGKAKAFPVEDVPTDRWVEDQVGETPVRFRYQPESGLFELENEAGKQLPVVQAYWFAWQAFYPDTEVYTGEIEPLL